MIHLSAEETDHIFRKILRDDERRIITSIIDAVDRLIGRIRKHPAHRRVRLRRRDDTASDIYTVP